MRTDLTDRLATLLQFVTALLLAASTTALAQTPQKCDVNGDGLINLADIKLIVAARNTPATGPNDPRDPDNNGVINLLDARTCQQRCTLCYDLDVVVANQGDLPNLGEVSSISC